MPSIQPLTLFHGFVTNSKLRSYNLCKAYHVCLRENGRLAALHLTARRSANRNQRWPFAPRAMGSTSISFSDFTIFSVALLYFLK